MGRITTYKHYKLNAPSRETMTVSSFKGVDYTPAQLNVADFHAVDIKNIIWKDNVDQKRNGLEHCACVPIVTYKVWNADTNSYVEKSNENERQINGVYEFLGEDAMTYLIVHAGKLLFRVRNFGKGYSFYSAKWTLVSEDKVLNGVTHKNVCIELKNTISQGFTGSHRLYLLDGNKYRVVRGVNNVVSIANVEDDKFTYVPTTTVGIGISWKEKNALDDEYKTYSPSQRTPLDDVNLLTQWRKNKLVSGLFFENEFTLKSTHFFDYELDTNIKPKAPQDINDIVLQINSLAGGN